MVQFRSLVHLQCLTHGKSLSRDKVLGLSLYTTLAHRSLELF